MHNVTNLDFRQVMSFNFNVVDIYIVYKFYHAGVFKLLFAMDMPPESIGSIDLKCTRLRPCGVCGCGWDSGRAFQYSSSIFNH